MQQYCLQWNDYQSSMISGFSSFLKSETLVDVTLAAEGRYVQAHKVLLSACSSYFQALFTVNPCKHPIVILKDVRFADLQTLLNFMYYGEVIASQDQLPSILKTAEMLEIKGLVKVTVENLVPNQVASDVIELKAPVQITRIVGGVPEQSIPSSPSLSPSRRRKRSRRSSAGSDSGLREHPPNESLSTSNELIASTVVETLIKNEPDETNLNESWEFDLHDESYEIVKEDLSDFHSDQIMLHLPKYEMHEALESSTMEFGDPGPSTSAEDPQPTEQPVGGEPSGNILDLLPLLVKRDRTKKKVNKVGKRKRSRRTTTFWRPKETVCSESVINDIISRECLRKSRTYVDSAGNLSEWYGCAALTSPGVKCLATIRVVYKSPNNIDLYRSKSDHKHDNSNHLQFRRTKIGAEIRSLFNKDNNIKPKEIFKILAAKHMFAPTRIQLTSYLGRLRKTLRESQNNIPPSILDNGNKQTDRRRSKSK